MFKHLSALNAFDRVFFNHFNKVNTFCVFLFAFLHTNPLMKRGLLRRDIKTFFFYIYLLP